MMAEEVPLEEFDDLEENFIHDGKTCTWKLRGNSLTWIFTQQKSKYNPLITTDIRDIVAIRSVKTDHYFLKNQHHSKNKVSHSSTAVLDGSTLKSCSSLEIHYAKYKDTKISLQKIVLCHSEPSTVIKWTEVIKQRIDSITNRPKSLLVFLNPCGGKKQAPKIYEKIVQPLFALAEIKVDLITTEYANHARDFLVDNGWKNYDGVVCVGGDGTFSEVVNGIIARIVKENNLDPNDPQCTIPSLLDLKLGIIPAGSTDTVVYSLHGTGDVLTAAFHVLCGDFIKSDICSVHNEKNYLCCFISLISYGYLGDIIKHSRSLRCLGPKRYDLVGAIQFIFHQSYEGTVSYLKDSDASPDIICKKNDCHCASKTNENQPETKWEHIRGQFFMVTAANISCSCGRSPNGISPYGHFADGYLHLVLIRRVTFLKKIKLLYTLSSKNRFVNELSFVEMYKTRLFKFETGYGSGVIPATNISSWNVDGELITIPHLQVRCHHQIINLFCRRRLNETSK
ncbi:ceramide kinase [Planococcus citri]|uniref:ceramide kinase n=1 Tax=Planococcus citri TaxID=170843 RepID=UPI0031F99851